MIVYTHPNNIEKLKAQTRQITNSNYLSPLYDFKIIADTNLKEYDVEYILPKEEKFWAYEKSDLEWLIPLGMAVELRKPVFYLMREDWNKTKYPTIKSYNPYR